MTLNINFTPQEEAWIHAEAVQQGLHPAEVVRKLVDERLPGYAAPVIDAQSAAAIALLDSWIAEGVAANPDTRREAERELEEFKRNMNANRAATGERLVYP